MTRLSWSYNLALPAYADGWMYSLVLKTYSTLILETLSLLAITPIVLSRGICSGGLDMVVSKNPRPVSHAMILGGGPVFQRSGVGFYTHEGWKEPATVREARDCSGRLASRYVNYAGYSGGSQGKNNFIFLKLRPRADDTLSDMKNYSRSEHKRALNHLLRDVLAGRCTSHNRKDMNDVREPRTGNAGTEEGTGGGIPRCLAGWLGTDPVFLQHNIRPRYGCFRCRKVDDG